MYVAGKVVNAISHLATNKRNAVALAFPVQFVNDFFSGMIFLEVQFGSSTFLWLCLLQLAKIIVRDSLLQKSSVVLRILTGSASLWDLAKRLTCAKLRQRNSVAPADTSRNRQRDKLRAQMESLRFELLYSYQNMLSELVAAVTIPLAVALELLFSNFDGTGKPGISLGTNIVHDLLPAYGTLFGICLLGQYIATYELKKRCAALRAKLVCSVRSEISSRMESSRDLMGTLEKSVGRMVDDVDWSVEKELDTHNRRFSLYFAVVIAFIVFGTVTMRTRLAVGSLLLSDEWN
jgi:hypothetical protein